MDFSSIIEWSGKAVDGLGVTMITIIVLVRTVLSTTLTLEVEGRRPRQESISPPPSVPFPGAGGAAARGD